MDGGMKNSCIAMGTATLMVLMIVIVTFVIVPLFISIFIPHPQIISTARESLSRALNLMFLALIIATITAICASIN